MSIDVPGGERAMLQTYLDDQRNHVLGILEGLDDEALRQPILPSGWSCLGMLHHLAHDVEHFWFRCVVAGEADAIVLLDDITNAWEVGPEITGAGMLAQYRQAIEQANAIFATADLDAAPGWWPEGIFGDWRVENTRQVILHAMTETASHAGHLDIVRELIDGKQWLVLTV
jgi:uncharacterized damage-inducible protein DinB